MAGPQGRWRRQECRGQDDAAGLGRLFLVGGGARPRQDPAERGDLLGEPALPALIPAATRGQSGRFAPMDFTVISYEGKKKHTGRAEFAVDPTTGVLTVTDNDGALTHYSQQGWLEVTTRTR